MSSLIFSLIDLFKITTICYYHANFLKMVEIMIRLKFNGIRDKWMRLMKWLQLAKMLDLQKLKRWLLRWIDFSKNPSKNLLENIKIALKNFQLRMVLEKLTANQEDLLKKDLDPKWQSVKRHRKELINFW